LHFFAKIFAHVKKKQYFCTRFLIERVILEKNGFFNRFLIERVILEKNGFFNRF